MTIEAIFGGKCLCCSWTALIIFGAGLFAEVIINACWFSKYYPWMSAASGPVKYVYLCTIICTIFSILTLLLLALMVICFFAIKSCSRNACACVSLCIFISLFTLVSVITAFGAGVYGMAGTQAEEQLFGKCYDHIFEQICNNVLDDVMSETFKSDYEKLYNYLGWVIDMLYSAVSFNSLKIPKDEYKEKYQMGWVLEILTGEAFDSKNYFLLAQISEFITTYGFGKLNNKYCASFYVPVIFFVLVEIIGYVWFLFTTCCGCCCGRKSDNNSIITANIQSSSLL